MPINQSAATTPQDSLTCGSLYHQSPASLSSISVSIQTGNTPTLTLYTIILNLNIPCLEATVVMIIIFKIPCIVVL